MKFPKRLYLAFFLTAGALLSCTSQSGSPADQPFPAELPTVAQLAPTPIVLPLQDLATFTPIPTATATLIPTSTPRPTDTPPATPTASPTTTETATITPSPQPIDLACPEQNPAVPNYKKNWLGEEVWPTPVANPQPHFWLDKPLPGGGRYLINQSFQYGWDQSGRLVLHNGVDAGGGGLGTELPAVGDGTIVTARADKNELWGFRCDWYGELVVLELDQKFEGKPVYALYGHVLNIAVEEGQRVQRGETVAEVGFGGAAAVPHLHFEVRVGRNDYVSTRNPMLWVAPPQTRGVIAGRLLDPTGRPWQGVWILARSLTDSGVEQVSWSYLDDPRHLINPDEHYAENFVFTDVLPGIYQLALEVQGIRYTAEVNVTGGEIATVEIVTEPFDDEFGE